MVTAKALIKKLKAKKLIKAEVVDEGDLAPRFGGISVDYDETTGEVAVDGGYYYYAEDSCCDSVDSGWSRATVCGVNFGKPVLGAECEKIRIYGDSIDYSDGNLTEEDVLKVASEVIHFPSYDADDFPFDISSVDEGEIEEAIAEELPEEGVFLETEDGRLLYMADCKVITAKRAMKRLVKQAKEADFDLG
jgi:hypothetical protein